MIPSSTLVPFSLEDFNPLVEAAKKDNHMVLYPSHILKNNDNDIIGYASVCSAPVVMVWSDSKKMTALQSVRVLHEVEDKLKLMGIKQYLMPCAKISPYFKYMPKLGFSELGESVWHIKNLNH